MATKFITRKEHIAICLTAFFFCTLAVAQIALDTAVDYNDHVRRYQSEFSDKANNRQIISFAAHGANHVVAGHHILALFICFGLAGAKRFIIPFSLTCLYANFLTYSLYVRYYTDALSGEYFVSPAPFLERFFAIAHEVDILAIPFISILLIWQSLIIWRNYPRILRRQQLM